MGMRGWAERKNKRTPTKYGHLGKVESWGRSATNPQKLPSFDCRGNSDVCLTQGWQWSAVQETSWRAEKWLERAKVENEGKGNG